MKDYGSCQRCRQHRFLARIPGTAWRVCLVCYIEWRNLPDDHPAKTGEIDGSSRSTTAAA